MSPVNAFHVYSSGDLSRHRERKKKKKKIHRSESRFRVSFQTSTRLFYQPKWIIARIFLVTLTPIVIFFNVLFVDQKIHSWKFSTLVPLHVFKHNIFLRGEEVIIHGYVQDELLLDFLLSLELFFLLFHRFIHVNVW